MDDLKELKPTIFITVPRILNRVYSKIIETVQRKGGVSEWLFNRAVTAKKYYYEQQGSFTYKMYDAAVFNKLKQ